MTTSDPGNGMEPSTAPASPYLCHGQGPWPGVNISNTTATTPTQPSHPHLHLTHLFTGWKQNYQCFITVSGAKKMESSLVILLILSKFMSCLEV